ncbi:MAG TPA: hypothetical protein GXZ24_08005 [Firmicutes bacterium]|nr:hypothetical protein [Bacillota bacterium]
MRGKLAFFILGVLIGLTVMNAVQGKKFEEIYWETEELKVKHYETVQQLKKIKEQHESQLPSLVKEIKLEIRMNDHSLPEPALRRGIYELVKDLLGQEVDALPYPLLYNLLEGRLIEEEGRKYCLEVEAVILGNILVYFLDVEKLDGENPV